MIYYCVLPIFLLLVIVFQTTVPEILFLNRTGLEISLILVIYAGFHLDLPKGSTLSFILGLMLDSLSGTISGFFTSLYVLFYFMSLLVSLRVYAAKVTFIMAFTATCALLEGAMIILLYKYIYKVDVFFGVLWVIVPHAVILGLASPLFFNLFHRLEVFLLNGRNARPAQ
jgi:hypothetical protein